MNQTLVLDTISAKKVARQLQQVEEIKISLLRILPEAVLPYGSALWWQKVELMADEDIRTGKVKSFKSAEALIGSLHKL